MKLTKEQISDIKNQQSQNNSTKELPFLNWKESFMKLYRIGSWLCESC